MKHKPFGLVLAGGGARGMAHVGVLRALNHLGYFPSAIAGVSMGAVVGATYALNPNWYAELCALDDSGFPKVPAFNSPHMVKRMKNLVLAGREFSDFYFGWGAGQDTVDWGRERLESLTLGKNLNEGRLPVFVAATDVLTGDRVVMSEGNAVDALYASSAIAGVLPPLERGDRLLIDGGYSDISPVDVLEDAGLECVVSVDPSHVRNSRRPQNGLEVYLRAAEVTHDAFARVRHAEADLVLKPRFHKPVGVLEYSEKRQCIAAGVRAVRSCADALHDLVGPRRFGFWRRHVRS